MSAPADKPTSPAREALAAALVREANLLLLDAKGKFLQATRHADDLTLGARVAGHCYHEACEAADKTRDAALRALQASWDAERGAALALREREDARDPIAALCADSDYSTRRMIASAIYIFERQKVEAAHYAALCAANEACDAAFNAPLLASITAMQEYMRIVIFVAKCTGDEGLQRFIRDIAALYSGATCKGSGK